VETVAVIAAIALVTGAAATVGRKPTAPIAEQASLERARPLPETAPSGQDAVFMRQFDSWTLHPGHEVSPRGVVAAFLLAERGQPQTQCDLIDDLVEGDCSLRNLFEQREQSVAGKDWTLQGSGSDKNSATAARVLNVALRRFEMTSVFLHLLTCNRYGWGACEVDWGLAEIEGSTWIVPTAITPVKARRFRIAENDELRLFADLKRPNGDELRPGKWIVMRRPGDLARAGLMRTAAWPCVGKRLGWRDWLVFSQKFGLPLPIASYADGHDGKGAADKKAIDVAEQIVAKVGSDGGAVVPSSIKLEMFDATRGNADNSKSHGGLIAHCNSEMAKLIAGATLTNDNAGSGGASYALGEVHAAMRWDNVVFDASRLQEVMQTQLFVAFMKFNNLVGPAPLLEVQVVRDLDPTQLVEMGVRVKNQLGIDVSKSQFRQITGLREPSGPDDVAPGMQVESFPAASGGQPS
jgi:phage gp29-like protein